MVFFFTLLNFELCQNPLATRLQMPTSYTVTFQERWIQTVPYTDIAMSVSRDSEAWP